MPITLWKFLLQLAQSARCYSNQNNFRPILKSPAVPSTISTWLLPVTQLAFLILMSNMTLLSALQTASLVFFIITFPGHWKTLGTQVWLNSRILLCCIMHHLWQNLQDLPWLFTQTCTVPKFLEPLIGGMVNCMANFNCSHILTELKMCGETGVKELIYMLCQAC